MARNDYKEAILEKYREVLMEKNYDGTYKVRIWNVKSKEEVIIHYTYMGELLYNGMYIFVLPLHISLKYMGSLDERNIIDYEYSKEAKFELGIKWKSLSLIKSIKSNSNPQEYKIEKMSDNEYLVSI